MKFKVLKGFLVHGGQTYYEGETFTANNRVDKLLPDKVAVVSEEEARNAKPEAPVIKAEPPPAPAATPEAPSEAPAVPIEEAPPVATSRRRRRK